MHFKVTARTILQLGAELISSDAIAFYELIKNAFDANSKKVDVRVVIRIDQDKVNEIQNNLLKNIDELRRENLHEIINDLIKEINYDAPNANSLLKQLREADNTDKVLDILKEVNYIVFKDTGEGMSLKDLDDIYLTIGTRSRLKSKSDPTGRINSRPVLGEKGLGRLSVMRLGNLLRVETAQKKDESYNTLEIDWTLFSHESDALIDTIDIEPVEGRVKEKSDYHGTIIYISDLKSNWTLKSVQNIAKEELSRFIDPFQKANRDFINVWFNSQPIILTGIEKAYFENAQAHATAELVFDESNNPLFRGMVIYNTYSREKKFIVEGTSLSDIVKPRHLSILNQLGPFSIELYWYNRQRISKKYGILEVEQLRKFVEFWGGGIMVYRDGFRVNPYGGPNDDWLKLDPVALASPGYKLNRKQIIGRLEISSNSNPYLLDQTNREGIRDSEEKAALVALLQHFIWREIKVFLDTVVSDEADKAAALSIREIENRLDASEQKVEIAVANLLKLFPAVENETDIVPVIKNVLSESRSIFKMAKASSDSLERRLNTTIQLAGLGLMIDIIAHELNRTTNHAIKTINSLNKEDLTDKSSVSMNVLKSQLKTLQTRLKVLDPLGPSGRQRKENTDLKLLITNTLEYHNAQFERHRIELVVKDDGSGKWEMSIVPGMVIQILENLINNSVYWIDQERKIGKLRFAEFKIELRRKQSAIYISDNGPGIPQDRAEEIFQPFFSTKPPGEGKGLGLYISREIAQYHGATLNLLTHPNTSSSNLHTFVFDLSNAS